MTKQTASIKVTEEEVKEFYLNNRWMQAEMTWEELKNNEPIYTLFKNQLIASKLPKDIERDDFCEQAPAIPAPPKGNCFLTSGCVQKVFRSLQSARRAIHYSTLGSDAKQDIFNALTEAAEILNKKTKPIEGKQ